MALFHKKSEEPQAVCGVVIPAAGSAQRMGGMNKVTLDLGGVPVLVRAVQPFQDCELVREIVVVTRPDLIAEIARLCRDAGLSKVLAVTAGGATRTESVLLGVQKLSKKAKFAAIHDGARPLVSREIVEETISRAFQCNAAAPAVPVKDTIKVAQGDLVTDTPDRKTLFAVQTPQVFDRDLLEAALTKALADGAELTDDCQAVERLGMHVHLTTGSERNLKITTPLDLVLANALLTEETT